LRIKGSLKKGSIITSNSFGGNFLQLDEKKKNVQKSTNGFVLEKMGSSCHIMRKKKSKVTIFREQVQTSHQIKKES
jgi:hypothetical protein